VTTGVAKEATAMATRVAEEASAVQTVIRVAVVNRTRLQFTCDLFSVFQFTIII